MARKPRLEVEGGLYHIITRGVDRKPIFHSREDHEKFLSLLAIQKSRLPFYLYAYCLMTNHIHLLIERMTDDIGRIMHRLLTGYTQYYNRRYRRVGHVLQGRHKAILCQSDPYLAELVRYIHLNPVRANMVRRPEQYPFSSHRSYLDAKPDGLVDVDPVLRRFGARPAVARRQFAVHVAAGHKLGHQERFYDAPGGILGDEKFTDSIVHRIGEFDVHAAADRRRSQQKFSPVDRDALLAAVEAACRVPRNEFCGQAKTERSIFAKEALIVAGRQLGASTTLLSNMLDLSSASVSRRYDAAVRAGQDDTTLRDSIVNVIDEYRQAVQES